MKKNVVFIFSILFFFYAYRLHAQANYEVNFYNLLQAKDTPFDGLTNHCIPERFLARNKLKGYSLDLKMNTVPAIRLSDIEHSEIIKAQCRNKTIRSVMDAESLLKEDIFLLRMYTSVPESIIRELKIMNKNKYGIDITDY